MRRLEKTQGLYSAQDSRAERKARTRHLIELGGLVVKAGLVELTDDDRAVILGACLDIAGRLRGHGGRDERPAGLMTLWRRRGLNAFAEGTRTKQTGGDS
ncbi:MAG: conjugal transfer protein TraD [Methylocella sp.]